MFLILISFENSPNCGYHMHWLMIPKVAPTENQKISFTPLLQSNFSEAENLEYYSHSLKRHQA